MEGPRWHGIKLHNAVIEAFVYVHVCTTHIDHAGILGSASLCDVTANRKTRITEFLPIFNIIAPGDRHVIYNPKQTHTQLTQTSQTVYPWKLPLNIRSGY